MKNGEWRMQEGNKVRRQALRLRALVALLCLFASLPSCLVASPLCQTWQTFTTGDGLPDNSIRAIYVCGEKVWVGTDGGLALWEGDAWRSWTERDGLAWPVISAIDGDPRTDDLWLGTWGGGLIRLSGGRFDQFTQFNSGLAGDLVFALLVEGDRVWAATNGGISSLDTLSRMWDLHMERRAGGPETAINSMSLDGPRASLYAGAWCGGVHHFDLKQGKWRLVNADPGDTTLAASVAGGSLWWVTQTHLFRRDETGTSGARALSRGLEPARTSAQAEACGSGRFVTCLAARSDTEAWLGSNQGLHVLADWDTDTWITIPTNRVRCIAFQKDDVWVGTANGLARGVGCVGWPTFSVPSRRTSGSGSGRRMPLPDPPEAEGTDPPGPRSVRINRAPTSKDVGHPVYGSADVETVAVAGFGPVTKTITLPGGDPRGNVQAPGADMLAIQLAIEQVNTRGGYRGKVPFTPAMGTFGYPRYAWGLPEDDLPRFALQHPVVGIVASFASNSRIATAVALRTEVPIVNVADGPATIDERINPWIFRCRGDDPRQHQRMLEYIVDRLGHSRLALLRTPGVLAKRHLDLWAGHARERNLRGDGLVADVEYDPGADNLGEIVQTLQRSGAQVVLTWCDVSVSARVLRRMREVGMTQLFVGSDRVVSNAFVKLAGLNPGPVIAPYPCSHRRDPEAVARFADKYTAQSSPARSRRPPTSNAYLAYHGTSHLLQAINIAGLDREAVRQTLSEMGEVKLAVLKSGRWEPVTLPE